MHVTTYACDMHVTTYVCTYACDMSHAQNCFIMYNLMDMYVITIELCKQIYPCCKHVL